MPKQRRGSGGGAVVDDLPARLIAWFDGVARDLPWRRARTGYRVWVSEVMLQQTRVSTVIPYFERFMGVFPDVNTLAAAPVGDVLAQWSGLGYYRRARALHEGARDVVARFGGELPRTAAELLTIKGVGPYTAGAIASLAFGERAPIVDGNVVRVLSRLFAIEGDARRSATQRVIWQVAGELVPIERPGAFNEALMELGATVCVPREPLCLVCPLSSACEGRRRGIERSLPLLSAPRAPLAVRVAALVARRDGRVLLGRRRVDALFGGLWEPPMIELEAEQTAIEGLSGFVAGGEVAGEIEHVLSHRRMRVTVVAGAASPGARYPAVYDEVCEVAEAELGRYGVSTLAKKVLRAGRR